MDYSEEFHAPGYLANEKLLPKTVIDQHKLSLEEWENKVSVFHKQVFTMYIVHTHLHIFFQLSVDTCFFLFTIFVYLFIFSIEALQEKKPCWNI